MVKCINAEHDRAEHTRAAGGRGRSTETIHVVDGYLEPAEKNSLIASCDCYVSLHRSEGFGLTMAEAMYLGKPVIATGYSGNLDFMTQREQPAGRLAGSCRSAPVADPTRPRDSGRDPDVDHAAALMRPSFEDPESARELGARAAEDIQRTHSPLAAGEVMQRRLSHLDLPEPHRNGHEEALERSVQGGADRMGTGPSTGTVRRAARRGALRLMRPYSTYQGAVNEQVVLALKSIEDELTGLGDRAVRDGALLEARLRSLERLLSLPAIVSARGRSVDELKDVVSGLGARVDGVESGSASRWQTDRSAYQALATLSDRYRGLSTDPPGHVRDGALTPFELRVFSQNGEDGVLAEILARIGVEARHFVEFGVETGVEANCVYLADVLGWAGLFIESDDHFFPELAAKYRASGRVDTVKAMITPENFEEVLAAAGVPAEPDVLSIDIDGGDYWVWESLENHRPRVVVIEYNSSLDPQRKLVQPSDAPHEWDGTDYYGASLGALRALGERKGYRLVHTELCGVNAFFVRDDLAGARFPPASEIAQRAVPNYFMRGQRHPHHAAPGSYLDLDTGSLVEVDADGS